MRRPSHRLGCCAGFLVAAFALSACGSTGPDPLHAFMGAPARVVWCQQVDAGSDDALGRTDRFRLMGYDSEDRRGERVILGEIRNYRKPLLSPDGATIVFSDWGERRFYAVDWSGANLRPLGPGMAVDVWRDPATGHQWVNAITKEYYWQRFRGTDLKRFRLDDPTISEPVWDQTVVSADNFQLSRDGRMAGGVFPWPNGAVADLATGTLSERGRGCWASIAPDDSYVYWLFDGSHRNLLFSGSGGAPRWRLNISNAPGIEGHEVYHPRWSNHRRFFAMTGPYKIRGRGPNAIHGGGDDVEVYLGRFSSDLREVDDWLKLTHNDRGDFFPDLWVARGEEAAAPAETVPVMEAEEAEAEAVPAIEIEATLLEVTPTPDPASIEPYRAALVFHSYQVERVLAGALAPTRILVGHWGIRDGERVPVPEEVGQRTSLRIGPLASFPDLEGERQLIEVSELTLPAFVEVGD